MSYLKCNGLTTVPTVTVMTDYTDHSYWIHPGTDHYLVGAEHVKQSLLRYRIPEQRIMVTGIPIRMPFTQTYDRNELRDKHGLHRDMPTVLVMGGGHGLIGKSVQVRAAIRRFGGASAVCIRMRAQREAEAAV